MNETLAMERGATGLTGTPTGRGEDESGDLVDRKIVMEVEHPQDRELAGYGALGVAWTLTQSEIGNSWNRLRAGWGRQGL